MELGIQILMGVSLAACAGLRAFLPLLVVGLMARADYLELLPQLAFLERTDALIVFGVATVMEFLGDKVIAVDHALDAFGTVARPVAGTVLASSMLRGIDPLAAVALGLVVGGGTAFTVHAGKMAARYKMSAFSPLHGGAGNALASLAEDVVSAAGLWITAVWPVAAFFLALLLLGVAVWLVVEGVKLGRRGLGFLSARRNPGSSEQPLR